MLAIVVLMVCQFPDKSYEPPAKLRSESEYGALYQQVRGVARQSQEAADRESKDAEDPDLEWVNVYRKTLVDGLKPLIEKSGKTQGELMDICAEGQAREWFLPKSRRKITDELATEAVTETRLKVGDMVASRMLKSLLKRYLADPVAGLASARQIVADYPGTDGAILAEQLVDAAEKDEKASKTARSEAKYGALFLEIDSALVKAERDADRLFGPKPDDDEGYARWNKARLSSEKQRLATIGKRERKSVVELRDIFDEGMARRWNVPPKNRGSRSEREIQDELKELREFSRLAREAGKE